MSPEAQEIRKKIIEALKWEKDPEKRARLTVHKRRSDMLRQIDIYRTRAIATRLGVDPGDLPPDAGS